MAAVSSIIAGIGLAVGAVGTYSSYRQGREAARSQRNAEHEQRKVAAEQSARNAAEAARESRQMAREERVRRAQIENQAALTGTQGSSGEVGALGAISTNASSNRGFNAGMIASGQRISGFLQNSAMFSSIANRQNSQAGMWGQVGGLGFSLFNNSQGIANFANNMSGGGSTPTTQPNSFGYSNFRRAGR